MSDFAEWRPCSICGLPVLRPVALPTIADKALKWPQIEDVLARLNRSTSPYPECWEVGAADVAALLATIFLLVDPELQGIAVSRDYLKTVHALLGFNT